MKKKIEFNDFVERARDLSRTNLLFIFGVIKAVSLSVAVVIFLRLFSEVGKEFSVMAILNQLPKFLMWSVSYGSLLITYDGALLGTLFLYHIPKKSETFFTFFLVGLETLQFAILSPFFVLEKEASRVLSVDIIDWWYIIFAIYSFSAAMAILNLKKEIKPERFSPSVQKLITEFKSKINFGILLGLVLGVISLITFFCIFSFPYLSNWIISISTLIFLILLLVAFWRQHAYRTHIENIVEE